MREEMIRNFFGFDETIWLEFATYEAKQLQK